MEKKMFLRASRLIFERAKELRNEPTNAELVLWGYLKQRPLGFKFRRQHPIASFIVDFYCHELKLVIEGDGTVHADNEVAVEDIDRQKFLEENGILLLRFTNSEVEKHLETVVNKIENYFDSYGK